MHIPAKTSLLDCIKDRALCKYISDLPKLSASENMTLSRIVESIPADKFTLNEWNDALNYICEADAEPTAAAAKTTLCRLLLNKS